MKHTLIALALFSALPALAEEAAAPYTLTGNASIVSSYRFRGIDQTFGNPALQGGLDFAHNSGFYLGNWNSNVSSGAGYPDGNLEMDFYGGYKTTDNDVGLDVGALYYYYPGSEARVIGGNLKHSGQTGSGTVDNGEIYAAVSWKFLSLKYSHAVTDYFAMPGTRGTGYVDLSANYDLGDGWGINGHVGHLNMKNFEYSNAAGSNSGSYSDWKLGITKDVQGWLLGLSYIDTNAAGNCGNGEFYCFASSLDSNGNLGSKTKDAGRGMVVFSVSRSF